MDFLTVFIVALFFLLMGGAIVGVVWYMQGVSKRMQNSTKAATPDNPNLSEIARLMRHIQTQDLVVQMDGQNFISPRELSPAQQRRLVFTSKVLVKWLAEVASEAETAGEAAIVTQEAASVAEEPDAAVPFEAPANHTPPFTPESVDQVKPVSTDLPDLVGGMLNPPPQSAPVFKSIAMEINDILQDRLTGTALESRGITLQDGSSGGVMVTLDGKRYNGVMEVPDEQVRSAIRSAVMEWETKK